MTPIGNSLKEAVQGSIEIGGAMVTPFFRARRSRWGTADEELTRTYPGDELVPDPKWTADHAITINATPEHVWPWIAQIGQGRGGFYSYQKLENLAGSEIVNTSRILDEHQHSRVGDPIKLHVQTSADDRSHRRRTHDPRAVRRSRRSGWQRGALDQLGVPTPRTARRDHKTPLPNPLPPR